MNDVSVKRWLHRLRTPLYFNAYTLILNQVVSAALGLLYWLLAARFYPAEVVGQSSALISTVIFISVLAEFSLKSAMIRFLPRGGAKATGLVLATYGFALAAGALASSAFFLLGRHFHFSDALLSSDRLGIPWMIAATMLWSIFYIQDGVLIGTRQAKWVLIENTIFNVAKIVLLLLGVWLLFQDGIIGSWFLPVPLAVVLVSVLIFARFLPLLRASSNASAKPVRAREVISSVSGDHLGSLLAEACVRLLPLMVINLLGKSSNAYFYQAWMVASTLYLVAANMATSFTVEAATNLNRIVYFGRRILRQMMFVLVPMAVGLFVLAPYVLMLFGAAYARAGTALLRWLAVSTMPIIINTWYLNYSRVVGNIKAVILNQALLFVLTLGLSYWWLPTRGITSMGLAWFIAQSAIAVMSCARAIPVLARGSAHAESVWATTRNEMLRRADWRFLTAVPNPTRSICFASGALAESVAAVSALTIDGSLDEGRDCDIAIGANPSAKTLKAALDSLREGGVCYTEWSAWKFGGARGIFRRLRAAGFARIQLFWPYPNTSRARVWLPLCSPRKGFDHLVRLALPKESAFQRVLRAVLAGPLFFALQRGLVPCLSAVAYRGASPEIDVFDLIRSEWSRTQAGSISDRPSFLVQTGGSRITTKIVVLVFEGTDPNPRWVTKLARVPTDAPSLRHEADILKSLQRSLAGNSNGVVVPQVIYESDLGGLPLTIQTALHGSSLSRILRPNNLRELATKLTRWQVALARATARRLPYNGSNTTLTRMISWFEKPMRHLLSPSEITLTKKILQEIDGSPYVCAHNDFTPWNVVVTQGGLGAFDWADAEGDGFPGLDIIYALSRLAFQFEDAGDAEGMLATYRRLLDPDTFVGGVFSECLDHYAQELALKKSQIPALRLLTWMLHSSFEYRNRQLELGDKALLEGHYESVCVPLWKAELHHQSSCPLPGPGQA